LEYIFYINKKFKCKINITVDMEETKNPNTEEAKSEEAKQQKPNPEIIILEFLRNNQNRFSMLELSRKTRLSYNTIQKYVIILQNKNLVDVKDFGNIKLVGFRRDQNEQQQL
jgi:response regulator of citrate/malate metabolism